MGQSQSNPSSSDPRNASIDQKPRASGSKAEAVELLRFVEAASSGDVEGMDRAIALTNRLVQSLPTTHPYRALYTHFVGNALLRRFQRGCVKELDTAIEAIRCAFQMSLLDDSFRVVYMRDLSRGLYMRYERSGSLDDLNEEIQLLEDLCISNSQDKLEVSSWLIALSHALQRRFAKTGIKRDLDRAVAVIEEAINLTPEDNLVAPLRLNSLCSALIERFSVTGVIEYLNTAILMSENVVKSTHDYDPQIANAHFNLCNALIYRFEQSGVISDLDEAIISGGKAVSNAAADPHARPAFAFSLGRALFVRYTETGSMEDSRRAVSACELAISLAPVGHPMRPGYLEALGRILQELSLRTGLLDLNRAIDLHEASVSLTLPSDAGKEAVTCSLARALATRFERTGSMEDLNRAIMTGREAVNSAHLGDTPQAATLRTVGMLLGRRFSLNGLPNDLEEAIINNEKAMRSPVQAPRERATSVLQAGNTFTIGFLRTKCPEYLSRAIALFEQVLQFPQATPSDRTAAAMNAGKLLQPTNIQRAAVFFKIAVETLAAISPRTVSRVEQQIRLSRFSGIASLAASALLETGNSVYEALHMLEVGRAVLLHQLLDARSDVTALEEAHPQIAKRFKRLRDVVDSPDLGDLGPFESERPNGWAIRAQRHHDAAAEFNTTIQTIRSQKNFERFLLGQTEEELISLAVEGPVVVFNVSDLRSDALLVTTTGLSCLPLPRLKTAQVQEKAISMRIALEQLHLRRYTNAKLEMKAILEWLWDAAVGPILDELGFTTPVDKWPHIWWVPCGLLNVFPLHAAGYHGEGSTRNALDRVVSSYIPTLKSLSHARKKASQPSGKFRSRILIAGMPQTPKMSDLRHIEREIEDLCNLIPKSHEKFIFYPTTKAEVLEHLQTCQIAHFACHGQSNDSEPLQSQLLLQDWEINPLRVADLMALKLENGQLAYLSVCHAASNRVAVLLDEAVHLTGACYLAGFPHVIGSLWRINDESSAEVAVDVYSAMINNGAIEVQMSAEALHHAVRRLKDRTQIMEGFSRRSTDDPLVWAPYIHLGA